MLAGGASDAPAVAATTPAQAAPNPMAAAATAAVAKKKAAAGASSALADKAQGPNDLVLFFANIQRSWESDVASFFSFKGESKSDSAAPDGEPRTSLLQDLFRTQPRTTQPRRARPLRRPFPTCPRRAPLTWSWTRAR
jgi:hypothetical protein